VEVAGPVVVDDAIAAPIMAMDFFGGGIIDVGEEETEAVSLVLGKQWRGGDEGLKVLKDLPEIWSIALDNAKITEKSLPYLAELPNLNSLSVHNTNLSRESLRKLREQKPELEIQARGEAMLGVNGDIGVSPMVLTAVFPDSGAYRAGLRAGDVIRTVDGSGTKDFTDLTISVYGRKPGEKIRVEYERAGTKNSTEVTLTQRANNQ